MATYLVARSDRTLDTMYALAEIYNRNKVLSMTLDILYGSIFKFCLLNLQPWTLQYS